MKTKILSILALLLTVTQGAWATDPTGSVTVYQGVYHAIRVEGTATDADVPGQSITVHVYVRQGSTDIKVFGLQTNASDGHFAGYVTDLAPGTYDVQVYALNDVSGHNPSIGYQSGVTVLNNKSTQPTGNIEAVNGENGSIYLQGWAFDPDSPDWSEMAIYVYVDDIAINDPGYTYQTPLLHADVSRPDVNTARGVTGSHGFSAYIPVALGSHKVDIYFQNDSGSGNPHVYSQNITVSSPFAISYDANGGTGAPSAQEKRMGINLTLSSDVPSRDGYTFAGWATSADGAVAYAAGATYTGNADLSLYAHWTKNEVTLTDGVNLSASGLTGFVGKQCDVSYTREFTVGKTSTVCLPFAYTKQGTEGSFYEFTSITEEDGEYVATMTEPVSTTLAANTPYLFTPAVSSVTFTGTIASVPATFTAGETVKTDWTFKGTFSTINWDGTQTGTYGFSAQNVGENISQGEFVKVGEYVRIKPMRCYLEYTGSDANWAAARGMNRAAAADEPLPETIKVRLIGANGDVTAIGTLHTRTGEVSFDSEAWYTLDGKRLAGQPTQKGIYVNNGKKVVIK